MEEAANNLDLVRTLLGELERRQQANPAYSLRAFAKHLGMISGALSQIIAKKRPLSVKTAQRLLGQLPISQSKKTAMLGHFGASAAGTPTTIDDDVFHIIRDWYHFAILNLIKTDAFQNDPAWIGQRHGISPCAIAGSVIVSTPNIRFYDALFCNHSRILQRHLK